ncbi:hypothetical protein Bsel_2678 [[Bacillus] selenitireducens MLS10]|uniref:Uncharacterized protein n=1 Tax=Bacillus selenitireducens (strain ATCC 700615 / DSM 15326 / MLS10) TaxID=439292 RepID=D6XYA7_BACIE|nr:hypothetical protein Bsel_2678 [[Bacillus] selenitireducens MLS10]
MNARHQASKTLYLPGYPWYNEESNYQEWTRELAP